MPLASQRICAHLPLSVLPALSVATLQKYKKLGITTVKDLLLHRPIRYENRATITPIDQLHIHQSSTVIGCITDVTVTKAPRKMFICTIEDESGASINLRFVNVQPYLYQKCHIGDWVKAYGEIKQGYFCIEIIHPHMVVKSSREALLSEQFESHYTPIYATTFGLSQTVISKHLHAALLLMDRIEHPELLPPSLAQNLPSITEAIHTIHQPPLTLDIDALMFGTHPAIKRLVIEELLAYQIAMLSVRQQMKRHSHPMQDYNHYIPTLLNRLPFQPTRAQQRVAKEIDADLAQDHPMLRLVQGDVGSGKTLVAALAALRVLENHQQVALMAPTEILAEQHYTTLSQWFSDLPIKVALLLGKMKAKEKAAIYADLASGTIDLIIGTHALFVDKVQFQSLGLIVIDEQHRFGVGQRYSLWDKGEEHCAPHQLIMTATPIPRTLAMSLYSHLAISIIDELPPGRKPITTTLLSNAKRMALIERIYNACQQGQQVYWVCTLVEESEQLEAKAAEENYEELSLLLPDVSLGLIHGRMKSTEKEAVMAAFKRGDIQLLVATTVIEVGVDVPNASIMVIENAERLGLSQLHQLRGRVGRGQSDSFCILMYQAPLSKTSAARLAIMKETQDGFLIAEKDFEIRGSGDILGTKQIGLADFKVVDLIRDQDELPRLQSIAVELIQNHPTIANQLQNFWLDDRDKYINA